MLNKRLIILKVPSSNAHIWTFLGSRHLAIITCISIASFIPPMHQLYSTLWLKIKKFY